jgi:hypothetical protein
MAETDAYVDGADATREDFTSNDFQIKRVLDRGNGHSEIPISSASVTNSNVRASRAALVQPSAPRRREA